VRQKKSTVVQLAIARGTCLGRAHAGNRDENETGVADTAALRPVAAARFAFRISQGGVDVKALCVLLESRGRSRRDAAIPFGLNFTSPPTNAAPPATLLF